MFFRKCCFVKTQIKHQRDIYIITRTDRTFKNGVLEFATEACACIDPSQRQKKKIPRASSLRDFVREFAPPNKASDAEAAEQCCAYRLRRYLAKRADGIMDCNIAERVAI